MSAPKNVIKYGIALHNAKNDILEIASELEKEGEELAKEYVKEGALSNCDLDFARITINQLETAALKLGVLHSRLSKISKKAGNKPVRNSDFVRAGVRRGR